MLESFSCFSYIVSGLATVALFPRKYLPTWQTHFRVVLENNCEFQRHISYMIRFHNLK